MLIWPLTDTAETAKNRSEKIVTARKDLWGKVVERTVDRQEEWIIFIILFLDFGIEEKKGPGDARE